MFMVMRLIVELEIETLGLRHRLPLKTDDGKIGMIPVFETREQAEAYAKGAKVLEIGVEPNHG